MIRSNISRMIKKMGKGNTAPEMSDGDEKAIDTKIARASQWQLIRWKFFQHKLAVVALFVLIIFYLAILFAEFLSPYDPHQDHAMYQYVPPQPIHFIDEQGNFHLRPFVYKLSSQIDEVTLASIYTEDRTEIHPLYLFVHGDPYRLWGLIESDIHLFGTKTGVYFFPLGTDQLGRDLLSLIIFGGRISLSIGLLGIVITFVLGILIGGISGYYGGILDILIQRITEFLKSIPTLPLWMALSTALPSNWTIIQVYFGIVIILSLLGWTDLARVVRGKFMSLKSEDFIMAAKLDGCSDLKIIFRYLLPSFMSYVIASLTLWIPDMIIGETSLSFIGLGLQSPAISWGVLLNDAQKIHVLSKAPWLLIPGAFVIAAILSFNFVGDALRDAADPYTKV